jgi:hypothetical protein
LPGAAKCPWIAGSGPSLWTQECSDPTPGGATAGTVVRDVANLFESGEDKPDRVVAHAGRLLGRSVNLRPLPNVRY